MNASVATTVIAAPAEMRAGTMLMVGRAMHKVTLDLGGVTVGNPTLGVRNLGRPGRTRGNRTLGRAREPEHPERVTQLRPPDRKEDGDPKIGTDQIGILISA